MKGSAPIAPKVDEFEVELELEPADAVLEASDGLDLYRATGDLVRGLRRRLRVRTPARLPTDDLDD